MLPEVCLISPDSGLSDLILICLVCLLPTFRAISESRALLSCLFWCDASIAVENAPQLVGAKDLQLVSRASSHCLFSLG